MHFNTTTRLHGEHDPAVAVAIWLGSKAESRDVDHAVPMVDEAGGRDDRQAAVVISPAQRLGVPHPHQQFLLACPSCFM